MRGIAVRWSPALVLALAVLVAAPRSSSGSESPAHGLTNVETTTAAAEHLPVVRAPAGTAVTWCGTPAQADLIPNTLAGHPVHWIYAMPSDAPDRFGSFATAMQTDADAIDAWWRREDPVRVPRNDVTQLSCGVQLDLTSFRMQQTSAQLASDGRFTAIFNALVAGTFRSPFTKYMVYFDGAVSNDLVCGQGAGSSSGIGLAVVYVQACAGLSTAAVAAHELLHTLGAVPEGAPHDCPEPNDAHTCDTTGDIMYPFLDGSPLEAKLLDPGRDDYYGHAAAFSDSQDAPWLVRLDSQLPFALTISGPGTVAADVPGLQCGQSCTTTWTADTRLNLSAVPSAGAKLVRWTGACSGASMCAVTVAQGASVSAFFAPLAYRLTIGVSGRGTVRSSRTGITCRPRCSAAFPSFVPIQLTATPAKGWKFRSWAGGCKGTKRSCTVPMSATTGARADFARA